KIFSFATTYSDFNILDATYGCSTTLNQDKNIYVWFIDKAGNISPDYNTIIGYDTTIPSTPTSFGASAGNGQVVLNWSAPSADNFSGNTGYKIYMNNSLSDTLTSPTTLEKTKSNLTNGTQYCFKISTIDNAGNESEKTSEVCATPQSVSTTISVKRNNNEIEYAKNDDEITINCSFSESASSAKIYAKYDSQSTQTIKSSSSSVTSISETMNIEGSYSQLRVWCEANGTSSSNKYITIDSTAPTIEWSDTNNDCSLLKKIMVKATDNKSLNKVDFLINNITYTTTKTDNNYYLDFNTQTLENGNYAIKAIAYDGAENIKEITRTININNILSENQICQKAITEAKAKKKIIEDLIKYLQEQGIIINTDILNKKKSADDLFNGAEVEQTINVNSATKKAEDAKKMYDEINTKLSNETKEAKNYETKEGTVKSTLKEIGFSEDIASIGEENSKNNERKLKIIQVGEEYHAVIELTIKNDTNSNTIKVIEIIPKELIDKASKIFSDQNFIILQEDPIIEFNLTLAPGETKTISYGTGVVTKEKSEELITKEIINNFASNPITLSEEIETKKIIEESNMSGMILIGGAIILVLLFIAILIIGGTILLKKTHGFGGEKTSTETKQVEIELKKEESWPKNPQ
ncbi:MAG TPA: Ig-like domain-containing protein, partial [archaeon]|nr:Ig-like domain-containing protein [archaeon]